MSTRNDIQASAPTPERIDAIRQWLSHRPDGRSPEVVFAVNVALDLLAEVDRLRAENERMREAFVAYETAIERAQEGIHNCQEWSDKQWDPINAARSKFYGK